MTTENKNVTLLDPFVRDYKAARDILSERVDRLQAEALATKRRLAPGIKSAAAKTRDAKARLEAQIEQHPELFVRPRTQTIDGIKIGYQKGKGKVVIGENAVKLIRKNYPDRFEELVKVTEKPIAARLQTLSAGELQRIGCQIVDTGDQIIIKTPKDDVEKIVDAILEDTAES